MQLFGSDRVANVMDRLNFEEGEVITHSWITKSLERAQSKVEQNNFSIRKKQLEYDDVLNNQREVIYKRRKHALGGDELRSDIYNMLEDLVENVVDQHYPQGELDQLRDTILRFLAVDLQLDREEMGKMGPDVLIDHIIERAYEVYNQKEEMIAQPLYQVIKNIKNSDAEDKPSKVQVVFTDGIRRMRVVVDVDKAYENEGTEVARALERTAVLSTIDNKWMDHLRELDAVKEGIGLRAYGQKDPLLEYKKESFEMFKQLLDEINQEAISLIWKAIPEMQADQKKMEQAPEERAKVDMNRAKEQHSDATNMGFKTNTQQQNGGQQPQQQERSDQKPQPVTVEKEPGRNDYVKIQNMDSGEVIDIKWKKAKRMIEEKGWVMIEK
ncbi:MAG: hypothetical protein U5J63_18320 [Fodinibius sp.]|nr:hypothetical protein [Fodinibius sp.]